jgi:hypothetical protein
MAVSVIFSLSPTGALKAQMEHFELSLQRWQTRAGLDDFAVTAAFIEPHAVLNLL